MVLSIVFAVMKLLDDDLGTRISIGVITSETFAPISMSYAV